MASKSSSQSYYKLIKWQHFPTLYKFIYNNFLYNKDTNISAILEESLSFPHSYLDEVWSCYRAFQDYPHSSSAYEKYKRSKELYVKIVKVEDNPKAWFDFLLEVGDDEFVIQNVEDRIIELDKELWDIYINYLHGIDINAAYEVYTRYINRFLDDTSLDHLFQDYSAIPTRSKNGYIKTKCNTLKPWERKYLHLTQPKKSRKRKSNGATPNTLQYSRHNQTKQFFSLPFHTMNAIISNASPTVTEKLNQSCKYFFDKKRTQNPILRTLIIDKHVKCGQKRSSNNALVISSSNLNSLPANLILTMALHIKECPSFTVFSSLSQRIYQSEIRFLRISSQTFTFTEFERVVNPDLLEFIHLKSVEILNVDDFYIALDQIALMLPAAKYVEFEKTPISIRPETPEILANLVRKNKLIHFGISHVNYLDEQFCQFLENHITDGSNIFIKMDKSAKNVFYCVNVANTFLEKWKQQKMFKNVTFDVIQG